jgi:catechol 2,3-dioxygenase-like lactoylglutathione lyase family enzyme
MRVHPMIQVADVAASSRWYQTVVGLESAHGGEEYEMLVSEGQLVLQLHRWDAREHGFLGTSDTPVGNGSSLWFETDTFDADVARALASGAIVVEGPGYNPLAHHHEITLRDPDGYIVVINSPFGDEPAGG